MPETGCRGEEMETEEDGGRRKGYNIICWWTREVAGEVSCVESFGLGLYINLTCIYML